jgi:phenylpropionate dioxygenase-like ring-hydroxylating dioxygenase large terminal subunit
MDQQTRNYLSQLSHQKIPENCLPNQFYQDEEIHLQEMKLLFAAQWAAVDFAHEVPEPGDAKPVEFVGVPLLLVRDRENQIRVYQNVCRHRGMILVSEPTRLGSVITCPYHAWCYGLDGKLRGTPMVGGHESNSHPDVKRDQLGLIEVQSHVQFGTIFVNLDGQAAPFTDHFAGIQERYAEFIGRPAHFAGAESAFDLTVQSNWKLAVENYCESYHLPFIHPELNKYSKIEDHYDFNGLNFSGQGTKVYNPATGDGSQTFPAYPDLSDHWQRGAEYPCLFPNLLFGLHRDHIYGMILLPQSAGQTRENVAIFYTDEAVSANEFTTMRTDSANRWRSIFEEDIGVVEGMQRGRHAPGFDGGRLSPVLDGATHDFHRWAATQWLKAPQVD